MGWEDKERRGLSLKINSEHIRKMKLNSKIFIIFLILNIILLNFFPQIIFVDSQNIMIGSTKNAYCAGENVQIWMQGTDPSKDSLYYLISLYAPNGVFYAQSPAGGGAGMVVISTKYIPLPSFGTYTAILTITGQTQALASTMFEIKDCGSPLPCTDTCSNQCFTTDLWEMKCENNQCVKEHLIESCSPQCGCGQTPTPSPTPTFTPSPTPTFTPSPTPTFTPSPTPIPGRPAIWTNKDVYCLNEGVNIFWLAPLICPPPPQSCPPIDILVYKSGGLVSSIVSNYSGDGSVSATAGPPVGMRTIVLTWSGQTTSLASANFEVKDCSTPDPCAQVNCLNQCFKQELWKMKCSNGQCVKDNRIENCSVQCGCSNGPCVNIICPDECFDEDLWRMKCSNGQCVKNYRVESCSSQCGCNSCPTTYDPSNPNCISDCPDSDGDTIPDCKDKCPEIGYQTGILIDDEGCFKCFTQDDLCIFDILGLIPIIGNFVDVVPLINSDLCEFYEALRNEDSNKVFAALKQSVKRIISMSAGLLFDVYGAPVSIWKTLYEAIKGLETIIDCITAAASIFGINTDNALEEGFDDAVSYVAYENKNSLFIYVGSPVDLYIIDDAGRRMDPNDREGILGGYLLIIKDTKIAIIINPVGIYEVKIIGKAEGKYHLKIRTTSNRQITASEEYSSQSSLGQIDTYNVAISQDGRTKIKKDTGLQQKLFEIALLSLLWITVVIIVIIIYLKRNTPKSIQDTEKKKEKKPISIICPNCGIDNPSSSTFCNNCGSRLDTHVVK